MKTKAAKIFSSIKYELCIFILLAVQAVINLSKAYGVGEYLRLYYLVDFSMGKTSRLLVGSLVKLLNPDPSPEWITGFAVIVVFAVLVFATVLIGKVIRSTAAEQKPQLFALVIFFITGIFTFSGFSAFLGVLDIWMFIVALLAIVCASNKYLRWLVPVFCAVGVFVHNGFAITYFPLVVLFVLYLAATSEKKGANIIVFVLSCLVTVALSLFVTMKGAGTVTVSEQEIYEALRYRGGYTYEDHGIGYILFFLLDIPPAYTGVTTEMVAEASLYERFLMMSSQMWSDVSWGYTFAILIFGVSVISAFWIIWIKCIKCTEDKSRRFVYACVMLSVLAIPVGALVAYDFIRWFQAGIITQFAFCLFMFYMKDEPFEKAMQQIRDFFSDKKLLLALVFIVYATAQHQGLSA